MAASHLKARLNQRLVGVKIGALEALGRIPPIAGRFVLCRPRGGFNDSFRQIHKCWIYAVLRRRTLIVDSTRSGMLDTLTNYFEPREDSGRVHLSLEPQLLAVLETLACNPSSLTGRIGSYHAAGRDSKFVEEESGQLLTFDFGRSHESPLLVHEQCGGGRGVGFLSQLRLTSEVAAIVRDRLSHLPDSYVGIHVRNTDVETDYPTFFAGIRSAVAGKSCLVCSDDDRCVQYAREYFSGSEVLTVSKLQETGGERLHENHTLDRWKTNVDLIADLIALAHATTILRPDPTVGYASGFADLAVDLNRRKRILRGLIDLGEKRG